MMIITMMMMTMTATTAMTTPEIKPTFPALSDSGAGGTGSGSMVKCRDDVTVMSCDMVIGGTERVKCITKPV